MPPKGKKSSHKAQSSAAKASQQVPPNQTPAKKVQEKKQEQQKVDLDFQKDLNDVSIFSRRQIHSQAINNQQKGQKNADADQGRQNDYNKTFIAKKQVSAEGQPDDQDPDGRSVWVKNVDYSAKAQELADHFNQCGTINRVTIVCDKYNNNYPLGYGYIQFVDKQGQQKALLLDQSLFKGRQISVKQKRRNIPGRGRFRGGRGFPLNAMFGMRFGMIPGMRRFRGKYYRKH